MKIYKAGVELTVAEAVAQGLVVVDGQGNVWLAKDTAHVVKITGDLILP
jgi:hypothetical protein